MNTFTETQIRGFLERAMNEGEKALVRGDYPIGAVLVDKDGKILALGGNENSTQGDITAHAELLCLRKMGINRLSKNIPGDYYLFTSLEPCGGCGFFIARTNIKAIVTVAIDPYRPGTSVLKKSGEFGSVFKDIEIIVSNFSDLAKKSKLLMRDYLISKGKQEAAKVYD